MDGSGGETSVKVAIRIRPQNAKEQVDMCRVCTFVTPGEPQVVLGKDKAFTYDYVYDMSTEQEELYTSCVEGLVEGCFSGLNATILAYGQTGSGKTYTMGTGFDIAVLPQEQGAVPRAVHHIFKGIDRRRDQAISSNLPPPQFELSAQFLELYNEEIIDLFDTTRGSLSASKKLKIHENNDGNIYVDGAITQPVSSEGETLEALKRGALSRSVGSTNMNSQSSRSHAIFTLIVVQRRPVVDDSSSSGEVVDWETLSAKFHFVDLAGSERLKRTGATGERAKEGISINCGLLALGNVISALGDNTKRGTHVPYRDSKITRLLQDSLGGNSQTLMIACVSPSDRDFMETLNTLKYANRARNIKNKVTVNQDKNSAQIAALNKRIQELELQIQEFTSGRVVMTNDGGLGVSDLANENTLLKAENERLVLRIKSMQSLLDSQNERLARLQSEKDLMAIDHQEDERATGQVVSNDSGQSHVQSVIQEYIQQIEDLRSQLYLSQSHERGVAASRHQMNRFNSTNSTIGSSMVRQRSQVYPETEATELLQTARDDIGKLEEQLSVKKTSQWRRKRERKRERSLSVERMNTDNVSDWMNHIEIDLSGSDTEINEDEDDSDEDNARSELDESFEGSWSSDSDELSDTASIATSIADLSTEINIKQQLVDQLEKAQRSLQTLRSQYEDKMCLLQEQIRTIETERDKMIRSLTVNKQEEQIKELKDKYEKQLNGMKRELRQLQDAKREHAIAVKKNAQQDGELKKMKNDLSDMKIQKVKLMKQLKKEISISKLNEQKKEKEIARLRKDHSRKENVIKLLQAEAKKNKIILKKKDQEMQALRRQQSNQTQQKREHPSAAPPTKPIDEPATKRARLQRRQTSVFSSNSAKKKWKDIERIIKEAINRRQTINNFETELERWLQKRQELSHRTEQLEIQRKHLMQATEDIETLTSIEDELEALSAEISWVNDSIDKLQQDIMTFEDTKVETDTSEADSLIKKCSTREAKYLLEHLVNMAIESGFLAFQKDSEVKVLKLRLTTSENHMELMKMYSVSPHVPESPLVINNHSVCKINHQMFKYPQPNDADTNTTFILENEEGEESSKLDETFTKYRRRTAMPSEIRQTIRGSFSSFKLPIDLDPPDECDNKPDNNNAVTSSVRSPPTTNAWMSPPNTRRSSEDNSSKIPTKTLTPKKKSAPSLSLEGLERPYPSSPNHNSLTALHESPSKGHIEAERSRSSKFLVSTHTVKGHTGGILTVHATHDMLISGSQDRTAKVWDLSTGEEIANLTRHHSYVRKVTYCPSTHLLFTACQSLIKAWDLRDPQQPEYIKTLQNQSIASNSADTVIQDMLVSDHLLFAAAGSAVNVWDLRQMSVVGRLMGHNGVVAAMATINNGILATGSRDRLIKLYDIGQVSKLESGFSLLPQSTLSPAHYDTVTSLAVIQDVIYSSCGVSIKKWDVSQHSLVQAVDGAHAQSRGNTITSLGVLLPSLLVSGCKSGSLKMWLTDNCQNIGDVNNAHASSINSISVNQYSVFTGSNDKTVKIWRPNATLFQN